MTNPTEKAPLAERVRKAAHEDGDQYTVRVHRRWLMERADEIAALEQYKDHIESCGECADCFEEMNPERVSRKAQAGPTLTDCEWLMWLAEKFPVFDPTWDQAIQDKWTDIFFALKSRLELAALVRTKAAEGAASGFDKAQAACKSIAHREAGTTDPPGADGAAPDAPLTQGGDAPATENRAPILPGGNVPGLSVAGAANTAPLPAQRAKP